MSREHSFETDADIEVPKEVICSDEVADVTIVSEHYLYHYHGTGQFSNFTQKTFQFLLNETENSSF